MIAAEVSTLKHCTWDTHLFTAYSHKTYSHKTNSHEINLSRDQLSRDQFTTKSTIYFRLKKGYFEHLKNFFDLVEKVLILLKKFWSCWTQINHYMQNQHWCQTSKKVKYFGNVSSTRLGAKEDLHLLVRLLMSHALKTIIYKIKHQIRSRSSCPSSGRDNTALAIIYMP